MTERVDEGMIVGCLMVAAPKDATPKEYLDIGFACAQALYSALAPRMASGTPLTGNGDKWSGKKRSRADTLSLCDMRGVPPVEIEHRKAALMGFEKHFQF